MPGASSSFTPVRAVTVLPSPKLLTQEEVRPRLSVPLSWPYHQVWSWTFCLSCENTSVTWLRVPKNHRAKESFWSPRNSHWFLLGVARTVKCRCHKAASYSFAAERRFGKTGCFVQNFKVRAGLWKKKILMYFEAFWRLIFRLKKLEKEMVQWLLANSSACAAAKLFFVHIVQNFFLNMRFRDPSGVINYNAEANLDSLYTLLIWETFFCIKPISKFPKPPWMLSILL